MVDVGRQPTGIMDERSRFSSGEFGSTPQPPVEGRRSAIAGAGLRGHNSLRFQVLDVVSYWRLPRQDGLQTDFRRSGPKSRTTLCGGKIRAEDQSLCGAPTSSSGQADASSPERAGSALSLRPPQCLCPCRYPWPLQPSCSKTRRRKAPGP